MSRQNAGFSLIQSFELVLFRFIVSFLVERCGFEIDSLGLEAEIMETGVIQRLPLSASDNFPSDENFSWQRVSWRESPSIACVTDMTG